MLSLIIIVSLLFPGLSIGATQNAAIDGAKKFVVSFHTGAVHMHLGQAGKSASFPFNLHTAAEARGATFKVDRSTARDNR